MLQQTKSSTDKNTNDFYYGINSNILSGFKNTNEITVNSV